MKNRTLAMLIAILMLLLTGCGNENSNSEPLQGNSETVSSETLGTETSAKNTIDYISYVGAWIADKASMDITSNNSDIINLSFFLPNDDGSRVASIDLSVLVASIMDNAITMAFEDSWGTSGTAIVTFGEESITFEIKNITPSEDMWGVYEGVFEFSRSNSQNSIEEEVYEEYYEPTPTYDTSKASGILASLGMTEEEFRASCQPLYHFENSRGYRITQELLDYPSQYIGQSFTIQGELVGESGVIKISSKGLSNDGYTTYTARFGNNIKIFDCRDDIYAPTISEGDCIYPYMIFHSLQTINGTDYLCFQLISADKQ